MTTPSQSPARHLPVVGTLLPPWMVGYRMAWLRTDILAGVTLAAVAIPECMGYSSIAHVPLVAGLYTIILPTLALSLIHI